MRKLGKKFVAVMTMVAVAGMMITGCGTKEKTTGSSSDKKTIGIGQFAEHGSLDNCRLGFLEGLKQEGYVENDNLTVYYENAQTDGTVANQIVDSFLAKDVDMICGIATPMASAAYGAARKTEVPVIYTAITDPIAAKFANEDGTPVGEVTGTSDKLPVKRQLEMIRELLPDAKKIGILYTTSEVNSISAIEEYKEAAAEYGFEIVESGISTITDVPLATDNILGKVDCLNNLTDNTVVSALPTILKKANDKNIPVFGSEVEQVKIGCLATVGLDYYELGIKTGKIAAKVLKGEKKASEINFETIEDAKFYGNKAVASNLGITLPQDLIDNAGEMFDSIEE